MRTQMDCSTSSGEAPGYSTETLTTGRLISGKISCLMWGAVLPFGFAKQSGRGNSAVNVRYPALKSAFSDV
jgi:hypothetical protein